MQLIIGGAFAGKRKIVKEKHHTTSWLSAYNGDDLTEWRSRWQIDSALALEGWEIWLERKLEQEATAEDIRKEFQALVESLLAEEHKRGSEAVLIMLEMGRGIVPLKKKERDLRDLAGWILQDAAKRSKEVYYVWHGLERRLK